MEGGCYIEESERTSGLSWTAHRYKKTQNQNELEPCGVTFL